jgi:hypothetical protein
MEDNWYRRFDMILLTPAEERSEQAQELHAWLEAFDDTLLGMRGRRDFRRRWCEDAFAAQRVVRELGRLPDASDGSVPARVHAWIAAQSSADLNPFQATWWEYVQHLGLANGDAARVRLD